MSSFEFLAYIFVFFVLPLVIFLFYCRDLIFGTSIKGEWLFSYNLTQKINNQTVGEQNAINFIDHAKQAIYRVSGEANPNVFSPLTVEAYKKAYKRGVKITMVVGPILLLHPTYNRSLLLDLTKEGIINLYVSLRRQDEHFCVSPNGQLYFEAFHEPGANERETIRLKDNKFEAKWFIRRFRKLLKDPYIHQYDPSKENFILLSCEALKQITDRLREKDKPFNEYTREELKKELEESGIRYEMA